MKHFLIDSEGESLLLQESETLNALVVLWVPTDLITLLSLDIPSSDKNVIKKALPFALEPILMEAPEEAQIGFCQRDKQVFAAVADKQVVQGWIAATPLSSKERVWAIFPDIFLLPEPKPNEILISCGESQVWMRRNAFDGVCLPREVFWAMLNDELESFIQKQHEQAHQNSENSNEPSDSILSDLEEHASNDLIRYRIFSERSDLGARRLSQPLGG